MNLKKAALFGGALFAAGVTAHAEAQSLQFEGWWISAYAFDANDNLVGYGYGWGGPPFTLNSYGTTASVSATPDRFEAHVSGAPGYEVYMSNHATFSVSEAMDVLVSWEIEDEANTGASFFVSGFHYDGEELVGSEVLSLTPESSTFFNVGISAANSGSVTITIEPYEAPPCPADFNGDTQQNVQDLLAFLGAYRNQDPAADINGSSTIDVSDLLGFLGVYRNGC